MRVCQGAKVAAAAARSVSIVVLQRLTRIANDCFNIMPY